MPKEARKPVKNMRGDMIFEGTVTEWQKWVQPRVYRKDTVKQRTIPKRGANLVQRLAPRFGTH
jgi:hypothetical protein